MDNPADVQCTTPTPSQSESDSNVDDSHDSSYVEGVSGADDAKITPLRRKDLCEDFSLAAKKRVDKVDKNEGRCIITNAPEFDSVHYAHLLPRSAKPALLEKLEYYWGMQFGSLHIDSRYNVMRLNIYLHDLFDRSTWILLPEIEVLTALMDVTLLKDRKQRSEGFRALLKEGTTFTYKMVPASGLSTVPIMRYSYNMAQGTAARPEHFNTYFYPFDGFPTISCHVQPHFVVCNIGMKMQKNISEYMALATRTNQTLISTANAIFTMWQEDIPQGCVFYHEPFHPTNDDGDNDSTVTKLGRANYHGFRRSLRQRQAATSPSSKVSQKRRRTDAQDSDRSWLDDETRELDSDESPTKRLKQKTQLVSAWVSSISDIHSHPYITRVM